MSRFPEHKSNTSYTRKLPISFKSAMVTIWIRTFSQPEPSGIGHREVFCQLIICADERNAK